METHAVIIPFLERHSQVANCVQRLLAQAYAGTQLVLVDDGSTLPAEQHPGIRAILSDTRVVLLRHDTNAGVAAARNTALHWCRANHIAIAIMLDSDCTPGDNFIAEHLRLHHEHPDAACIGAQIIGRGESCWAKLDGLMSWVHATPHSDTAELHRVEHPYHLATTNFSAKLALLPARDFIFDERLVSGEDCLLVRELRRNNKPVYFSASPVVTHQDREHFVDVFKHHYEWGHHQYFIQLGGDLSPRCFDWRYRIIFACVFYWLVLWFALAGTVLNAWPAWRRNPATLWWLPLMYLLWLGKAIAVLESAAFPLHCLRSGRDRIAYRRISATP